MSFEDNNESNQNKKVASADFLPKFFRTNANNKFLQATLDQLIQPGEAEKIQGYFGRKTAKAYKSSDVYIDDVSDQRNNYQLEPALVSKDEFNNVKFYKDYNDYVNQLDVFGADTRDHSKLNSQETYAWNPNIDWDKFVNYREYYWLPNGPQTVNVKGQSREVVSTYTVSLEEDDDNTSYVFNDGLTRNPTLKLYRGQTYRFEVDVPGHPIAFAISRTFTPGAAILVAGSEGIRANGMYDGALYDEEDANYDLGDFIVLPEGGSVSFDEDENVSTIYPDGIRKFGEAGEEVATVYLENGTIEFTIPSNAPDRLYYISKTNIDTSGYVKIADIEENTFLDIDADLIGKKTYTSANGVELTNGLKLKFQGDIYPNKYETNEWYVEGVGESIKLIKDTDLIIPAAYASELLVPFDSDSFDTLPFSNANSYTSDKDYIVINRASKDKNAWSRYNKWFHKTVIEKSAEYNSTENTTTETARAKRPIIEFEPGLKLNNNGSFAKQDVNLIDTVTTDVFSTIEGQVGYRIDGVELADNMRVLFAADTDILVSGKIYVVKFIKIGNNRQINLVEAEDTTPIDLETVLVTQGRKNAGKSYHYHDNKWSVAQEKISINQSPLFEVFDIEKNSFSDTNYYPSSTFKGTKLFSYKEGSGQNDTELGFPLSYRNINNSGDIVFEFNLFTDVFTYELETDYFQKSINPGFLKKYKTIDTFEWANGLSSTPKKSVQKVIRQYVADEIDNRSFEIDVYNSAGEITDLVVNVFVNNKLTKEYTINKTNKKAFVVFNNDLNVDDNVIIKTQSNTKKNVNGYYEFPINLERNPKNEDFTEFTLGEVIDHVDTMIEDLRSFEGVYPGVSNLRDIGDIDNHGKRFVKHSGPINLSAYHVTNKNYNLVKALNYSRREYARFKRNFLEKAVGLGIDTDTKQHVDAILKDLNKDKVSTEPYYFSDALGYQSANIIEYTVLDKRIKNYALTESFDITKLTNKSVNVYLNKTQLVYGVDYDFGTPGFIDVFAESMEVDDILEIYEYASTDGTFIPPTPTKLGLFPAYTPELTYDDTYRPEAGSSPTDDIPYKIYAQSEEGYNAAGQIGWFYPLYTTLAAAQRKDTESGGNGSAHKHMFKGTNIILYMPNTGATHAGIDTTYYDAYPVGQAMIKGHDGSYTRCFTDFRDNLLLDLEKRMFNNIKVRYNSNILNVDNFLGGEYRKSDYSRTEIDSALLRDFSDWLTYLDNDYTDHYFYLRQDEFTFNYSSMKTFNGNSMPGFWRGMYKRIFDTDRPHTHPWEMVGFTIKPSWWNDVYGPAPYTGDNLLLWEDLEEGKIAEPGKERFNSNYTRPGLTQHIPVDRYGSLKTPLEANIPDNFVLRPTSNNWSFGDHAPVETAWRRSSEFPFAVITAMVLNKPAETVGLGFDISRIQKNFANQYIYNPTSKLLKLEDLVLPNTIESENRTMTSGLVNYISNLISSNILKVYKDYESELKGITNQLGVKLAGFTDKDKVNVILDSRSIVEDQSQSGVFIPQENYDVFLNTSSPTDLISYSGIAIEKVSNGFKVRGYSKDNPYFDYYNPSAGGKKVVISVGGIGEVTTNWAERTIYERGQVVENAGKYYRVTSNFTSGTTFDTENLAALPGLPVIGGKSAEFSRNFSKQSVERIPYGHRFSSSQEVITFILGYGERLKSQGFEFGYTETGSQIDDWNDSAKEFLFWTTQGWASGTTLCISPGANRITFAKDYNIVDDLSDPFYIYSLYDQEGQPLDIKLNSLLREQNSFGIQTSNTDLGVFHVALPVVQKEHVLLFDNKTVFNDILYQPYTGYRQERIKVNAYRSSNWNGGFNVPGFVFDDARYTSWEEYQDYQIGDLVKYRQYYYTATENITGTAIFDDSVWYRLSEEPEKKLLTNFDYRINQFMDFYDLDSAGFDKDQQELAQHLIGYQKRQYLANIINDDVSQFKFYNGFIQDKGTMNSVTKLFDSLSSNEEGKLKLFEEWALQLGRYGAVDNEKQIEIKLSDSKLEESPQIFELTDSSNQVIDKIYRVYPKDLNDKPFEFNHTSAFPTTSPAPQLKTGGYVNSDDVTFIAYDKVELLTADINQIDLGDYIWLVETGKDDWAVYQLIDTDIKALSLETTTGQFNSDSNELSELTINQWANGRIEKGELFAVLGASSFKLEGIYEVHSTNLNTIYFASQDTAIVNFDEQELAIVKLRNVRIKDTEEINDIIKEKQYDDQRFWVDNFNNGEWNVLENNPVYSQRQVITHETDWDSTDQEYGEEIAVTNNNRTLIVGSPGDIDGKITVYNRSRENSNFVFDQEIRVTEELFDYQNSRFGQSIDVSPDGEYIAVGIPEASNVKTKYKGEFDATRDYVKGDIITFRESIWQALRPINSETVSQDFNTWNNYQSLVTDEDTDSTNTVLLVSGDPSLENNFVDHILVRAPIDMYLGTKGKDFTETRESGVYSGDIVSLYWNQRSFLNPTLDNYLPFDGAISSITPTWIRQEHEIIYKVDFIIEVETFISLPDVGEFVTTTTGRAKVVYVSTKDDSAVIYVSEVNGSFDITGEVYIDDDDFIGLYSLESTFTLSPELGGYWLLKTYNKDQAPVNTFTSEVSDSNGFTYNNGTNFYDVGRGMVYADILLAEEWDISDISQRPVPNLYFNIQDAVGDIGPYVNAQNRASFITQLAYFGDPTDADGQDATDSPRDSNLWVVRADRTFSDETSIGQEVSLQMYDLDNRPLNYENAYLSDSIVNVVDEPVFDKWDGYIEFTLSRFDALGFAFQPQSKYYHVGRDMQTRTRGDVIVDVQTASDGSGGLAVSSLSPTSAAEIMYIQRSFNSVRVFVKILADYDGTTYGGRFNQLNNIGKYELKRLANEEIRGSGDVDRVFGEITDPLNEIAVGTSIVGDLLVFQQDGTFVNGTNTWLTTPAFIDEEYYFYTIDVNPGIALESNPPYSLNKDYRQIYNLPADKLGISRGYTNEGAVSIYRRNANNQYILDNTIVSLDPDTSKRFGNKVKLVQKDKFYTLLIGSLGDGTSENAGTIEIYNTGLADLTNFTGDWRQTSYSKEDVVYFKDRYYEARRDTDSTNSPTNPIYWNDISWRKSKDANYRGDWNNAYSYAEGNIVLYNDKIYQALTNVPALAAFNISNWKELSSRIDYIGYLPNVTGNHLYGEDVYDPTTDIESFGEKFDVSDDAEVLVATARVSQSDSLSYNQVVVYRKINNQYALSQIVLPETTENVINPVITNNYRGEYGAIADDSAIAQTYVAGNVVRLPNDTYWQVKDNTQVDVLTVDGINGLNQVTPFDNRDWNPIPYEIVVPAGDWGENISINPQGDKFVITAPTTNNGNGSVFVYELVDGIFTKVQELTSPQNEVAEKFGFDIDFGKENLLISSLNGDQKIPTTFDGISIGNEKSSTTFDNEFTFFNNIVMDKGVIYVYENINDSIAYAEQLIYPQIQTTFGDNLYNKNNHIYVGMPQQATGDQRGQVVNFRKDVGSTTWNTLDAIVPPVDIEKINGITLYNNRTNEFISRLDYIDPLQGKIPGPAEQEIDYKLGFDPAAYNTGLTNDFLVDPSRFWGQEHVGEVWWATNTARFAYPYKGTANDQKKNWSKLISGSDIDIFEWVESDYIPQVWDEFSDTDKGLQLGISGQSVYGNTRYSTQLVFDKIAQTFRAKYYFWVQNKRTIPTNYKPKRLLNTLDISNIIANPRQQGYKFVSLIDKNKFILNNCNDLIQGDDVVIQIRYKEDAELNINRHNEYQIVSEGLESSIIHPDIERKWWDSLIGFDENLRSIPDLNIPANKRYGIQNRPRQSMFKNRFEALKQTIEKVNLVLSEELIIDSYNFSNLLSTEAFPNVKSGTYDVAVDNYSDLTFISTNKVSQATIELIISNGSIVSTNIVNAGRGYKVVPSYELEGAGTGAELSFEINNLGQITKVNIENGGSGYLDSTRIVVRPFSVLVKTNENLYGKWSIFNWNGKEWFIKSIQDYDVTTYWEYIDWYAAGYNQFTTINYNVDGTYLLPSLGTLVGDTVKVNSTGTGGWILLEKTGVLDTEDYTQNYKVIGRENGTIKFKDTLYNYNKNAVGFDNRSFDSFFYDNTPATELRIILKALKDDLFVGNLKAEYNNLFFVSVRYLLAEQKSVDWLFKTSFVKALYNISELRNDITFNSDNLQSFEDYLKEVKPYKTKIREYIDVYDKVEPTNTSVTDFDLPPYYSIVDGSIVPNRAVITNGSIDTVTDELESYPRKHFADNIGYQIKDIKIKDGGSGYTFAPTITVVGNAERQATATAYLGYGKITSIKVTDPGKGYIEKPTILIEGPQTENSTPAKVSAILGNSVIRTADLRVKFDRLNKSLFIETLAETESFTGTNVRSEFDLEWPMDLDRKKVRVFLNDLELLRSKYSYENVENDDKSYTRQQGRIKFVESPKQGDVIRVEYVKLIDMLSAIDRVHHFYEPVSGMLGKDFAQLMKGIDYGGVEVKSIDFAGPSGWDTAGWYTDTWDTFDNTYEDEVFTADGSTIAVQLSAPLENGVVYNLYKNGVKIDAPDFVEGSSPTNVNAITPSITGDGTTDIIYVQDLGISLLDGDLFVVRKTTSDGSIIPDAISYDTQLSGGDLPYETAKGVNAEEIVVDGDGFVNPITHAGPEELVPGLVTDALDIKVYTRDSEGSGVIYSQSYTTDGVKTTFNLGTIPSTNKAIFVKINDILVEETSYTIDHENNILTLNSAPAANQELNIISQSLGTDALLDYGKHITDGSTTELVTTVDWIDGASASVSATVDGEAINVIVFNSETEGYELPNPKVGIRFNEILLEGRVVHYAVFSNDSSVNYSRVITNNYEGDGSRTSFTLDDIPFNSLPLEHKMLVKVGNKILNPGYNIKFTIPENNQRTYPFEKFQQPPGTLEVQELKVLLNGEEINNPIDWRYDVANATILLTDDTGTPGDTVEVIALTDGEYAFGYLNSDGVWIDTPGTLHLKTAPILGASIEIFQFSNHDILGIERVNYDVVNRYTLTGDAETTTYRLLKSGIINLRSTAVDAEYVWVSKNGELLTPSVDYYVTDDRLQVRLVETLSTNDVIDVLHFTAPVGVTKFAYRQFKDMLNRTHYKRLDKAEVTLRESLNYYDQRIEVNNGNLLAEPNRGKNLPGIIWINGERIEYFVKEDDTLRQIRRGTLGTGVKNTHEVNSKIYDQNISKTLPYQDTTQSKSFVADGVTSDFEPGFDIANINEVEVFVGGVRLRKSSINVFEPTSALDSPEGDTTNAAEFSVDDNIISIVSIPADETQVMIVKKTGTLWSDQGTQLALTENSIARFLRAGTSELPE